MEILKKIQQFGGTNTLLVPGSQKLGGTGPPPCPHGGCAYGLGLEVLVSRRSRDLIFEGLGLVSVSGNLGRSWSRSRLGLKTKCLVSVSKPKVSFTSLDRSRSHSGNKCTNSPLDGVSGGK